MNVTIAPLPPAFLDRVRNQGLDDLGQPVRRLIAEGGEPCRDVLRRARPGEELLLASFSPFTRVGPYREYGPVFVLASPSDEEVARDAFPATDYFRQQFVLRAYSEDERIVDAAMVTRDAAGETLSGFLGQEDVAFVHARFPLYGCFALRVEKR
ncbi:MAG TPA: DUF1203 domain-containing protein [Thermoanaerobaculia bacterium]